MNVPSPDTHPLSPILVTHGGRVVPVLYPQAGEFLVADIAHHLARINRFSGAGISVAQHCVLVALRVASLGAGAEVELHALLHDAPEMITGDQPAPYLAALEALGFGAEIRAIDKRISAAIVMALGLPAISGFSRECIVLADIEVRAAEIRDLFPLEAQSLFGSLPKPWPDQAIERWYPLMAEERFLAVYERAKAGCSA